MVVWVCSEVVDGGCSDLDEIVSDVSGSRLLGGVVSMVVGSRMVEGHDGKNSVPVGM